ncbi:MAG TPA: tRNA threonylcarbamoyladenosine dehydratase [Chitinispirillaceae bacterium]|nr:tRNA threonylcarbamoyladenosine dehydratase [Chitinispirillaceae bacterium]
MVNNPAFNRLRLLTGEKSLLKLSEINVIIFGLGGVGSWCAEALIRSGIHKLTIVDSDVVCVTNINRQVQATISSIGKSKVLKLRERLLDINPQANISAIQMIYDQTTSESFNLSSYDFVVDAIDSLSNKVDLIIQATKANCCVISALGASCKMDPKRIKIGSLWESRGCRLGKFVRKRLRKRGFTENVTCIYSDENIPPQENGTLCGSGTCLCPKIAEASDCTMEAPHEWCSSKKQINGSAVHITAIYGFMIAGLIIQNVVDNTGKSSLHEN